MRYASLLKSSIGVGLRFLLPWACAGCRTPLECIEDVGFCGSCWLLMPRIDGLVCQLCGVPLKDGGKRCYACQLTPPKLMVRAATSFRFPIQHAIHRFKYAGRKTLLPPFKLLLEYAWKRYPELLPIDALMPVPLYRGTQHDRGYNQAELLAEALASSISRPVWKGLIRPRRTTPQFNLSKAQRLTNLQDAFGLDPKTAPETFKNKHILLIDDVCTTTATLKECAFILRTAGAARVKALVLARDI